MYNRLISVSGFWYLVYVFVKALGIVIVNEPISHSPAKYFTTRLDHGIYDVALRLPFNDMGVERVSGHIGLE
jgi:hypothetical protein